MRCDLLKQVIFPDWRCRMPSGHSLTRYLCIWSSINLFIFCPTHLPIFLPLLLPHYLTAGALLAQGYEPSPYIPLWCIFYLGFSSIILIQKECMRPMVALPALSIEEHLFYTQGDDLIANFRKEFKQGMQIRILNFHLVKNEWCGVFTKAFAAWYKKTYFFSFHLPSLLFFAPPLPWVTVT